MIKRVSLVWKKPGLNDATFKSLWLGEHAKFAKQLQGLRSYVIDFVVGAGPGLPSAIATLHFDDRDALDRAFSDAILVKALHTTRDQFAARVEVLLVDEHKVFETGREDA